MYLLSFLIRRLLQGLVVLLIVSFAIFALLRLVPGDPALPYCEREDDSPRAAHVVYGDAALSGLLEEYARHGGKKEVSDAQARLQGR